MNQHSAYIYYCHCLPYNSGDIAANIAKHSPSFPAIPLGPVRQVIDVEKITVGSICWEVVWTPGHSPGHICLFERRRGLLFTGNHILPHDTPVIQAHPNLPSNLLGKYLDSLRMLASLPVQLALPGHGAMISDFKKVVSNLIFHHAVRFADIVGALQAGAKNSYEVACKISWVGHRMRFKQLSHRERWLALSETVAHLHAMEACEAVESISENGGMVYHPTNATGFFSKTAEKRFDLPESFVD